MSEGTIELLLSLLDQVTISAQDPNLVAVASAVAQARVELEAALNNPPS